MDKFLAHPVELLFFAATSLLWLAFFGKIAWRNRRNQFLFFGWIGVLIVFALLDIVVFVFVFMTTSKPL
jgi:hypothetical protein